jgi:hypothetical protein
LAIRKTKLIFFDGWKKFTFISACDRLGRLPLGNIHVQIACFSLSVGVESI